MNKITPTFVEIALPEDRVAMDNKEFPIKADPDGMIRMTINVKTAKVEEWKSEYGYCEFWVKACDEGIYRILDEDKKELDKLEGYVPNKLIPEHDGCGDYISMTITRSGYISNWYKKPDLSEFNVDFDEIERIFKEA